MKELVILSGKGGTGKTSITAAFAALAENMVLCDTDVDAADLHLIAAPGQKTVSDFVGGHEAVIIPDKCSECGTCIDVCRFEAVSADFKIDAIACEGCGVCVTLCPEQAIDFPETVCGQWFKSETRFGPMVHARLGIAQENSGKLVSLVRQEAKKIAKDQGYELILTDGPPGVGCPVIAAIGQASALLVVAEPTVSGLHDMERVVQLADHFQIPAMVCINKYDLNPDQTREIEQAARKHDLPVAGKIPFDRLFVDAVIKGQTIFEYDEASQAAGSVKGLWERVCSCMAEAGPSLMRMK